MIASRQDHALQLVVRNVRLDRMTAEVANAFAVEGIETLVLKGPTLGEWLYPDEVRPYCDSDLMVAPDDKGEAICVLEKLGFEEYCPWRPEFLSVNPHIVAFQRDDDMVDLHCALRGLAADPRLVWDSLLENATHQGIGGRELRTLDRDSLLLLIALHAAHHAGGPEGKPEHDLRLAVAHAEEPQWRRALELARAYRGVPAFAAGLQLLPEGRALAAGLGVDDVRSVKYELRRENSVVAEELAALFTTSDGGSKDRLVRALSAVFPKPRYMRWRSRLARYGTLGLVAAYCWRAIWALVQTPRAIWVLWRARRKCGPNGDPAH